MTSCVRDGQVNVNRRECFSSDACVMLREGHVAWFGTAQGQIRRGAQASTPLPQPDGHGVEARNASLVTLGDRT